MGKKVVLVLGMHRSGTSALAHVISELGFYLGTNQLGASQHNEEGHYERNDVIALNTDILRCFQMEWFSFSGEAPDLSGLDASFAKRANGILDEMFAQSDNIVIKEPRMCVTLPFWQQIFEARDVTVEYVFIFRHPKSVALSLKRRNSISLENGQALWLFYNQSVLSKIDKDAFMINYDEMVNRPKEILGDLSEFLAPEQATSGDIINKALRHHVTPIDFSEDEAAIGEYYRDFIKHFSGIVSQSIIDAHLKKHSGVARYLIKLKPLRWHCQVFFNSTKTYTEEDSVQIVIPDGEADLSFDLSTYGRMYAIRFDPHMYRCRLKLTRVDILNTKGRLVKYKTITNAETVDQDLYTFSSFDPQVQFVIKPQKLESIKISFEIFV